MRSNFYDFGNRSRGIRSFYLLERGVEVAWNALSKSLGKNFYVVSPLNNPFPIRSRLYPEVIFVFPLGRDTTIAVNVGDYFTRSEILPSRTRNLKK